MLLPTVCGCSSAILYMAWMPVWRSFQSLAPICAQKHLISSIVASSVRATPERRLPSDDALLLLDAE